MSKRDTHHSESEWDSDDPTTRPPAVKVDASPDKSPPADIEIDMNEYDFGAGVNSPTSPKSQKSPKSPISVRGDVEEHYAVPNNPPFDFAAALDEVDLHSQSTRPAQAAPSGFSQRANVYDPSVDTVEPKKKKKMQLKGLRAPKFAERKQDSLDHYSLDSHDSEKVELVVIKDIVMEPIADNVEMQSRRYIREFWTAIGLVLGVILVFVTELVRMLLLRVVRPLLLLVKFAVHLLTSLLCGMLFYILAGLSHAVTPCVNLAAQCSVEVFVPCFRACRCVQVDQRHVYGETIAHLALQKNEESV